MTPLWSMTLREKRKKLETYMIYRILLLLLFSPLCKLSSDKNLLTICLLQEKIFLLQTVAIGHCGKLMRH